MKRAAQVAAIFLFIGVPLYGSNTTMEAPMTDAAAAVGVSGATMTYTLDMSSRDVDYISAQVIVSSDALSNVTFNDGRASTATITIVNPAVLSTAAATGYITVLTTQSLGGVVASTSILISSNVAGTVLTITGPPFYTGSPFVIGGNVAQGFSSTSTAANLGALLVSTATSGQLTSTVSGASVTISAISSGTIQNAWAITSSSKAAIGSATFASGVAPATVTVAGAYLRAGYEWQVGADTTTTAQNIMKAINLLIGTNTAVGMPVMATNTYAVIYTTAGFTGSAGNTLSLVSSISSITVSAAMMTGGADNAQLCINGTCLKANTHWYPVTSTGSTCTSLYQAINSSFTGVVTSTCVATTGVIYATSTAVGSTTTYVVYTSTQNGMTISPYTSSSSITGVATGSMYGGTNSSFTLSGQTIGIASHGLPLGLGVYLSTAAGTTPLYYSTATTGGTAVMLGQGVTYYVIPITANSIQLALTSTMAVAGVPMTWVSSATKTTTDTYTLTVPAIAGSPAFGFWYGNDGTNFVQTGSTYTVTSFVYPSSSTFVDFGNLNWRFLQLRVVPPSAGAASIKAIMHGERR